jgi:pyrroloquinoline quinone (PQQ) biosynthesis protein C
VEDIYSKTYPKFRENIWRFSGDSEKAYLITSDEAFEVDSDDVKTFLKIRSHCTGHNNIADIANKSGIDVAKVESIINSLAEIGITYPAIEPDDSDDVVNKKFINLCEIWSEELKINFIGNKLMEGKLPREALIGWLIEMYHYISDFPAAIDVAVDHAEGELKTLLIKYANEERHHNVYVLRTLKNLCVKEEEVRGSTPMLSTRLVGFIMRDLFQLCPSSVLIMAALVEANEVEEDKLDIFNDKMKEHYNTPDKAFKPYFDHQDIDAKLGHVNLLKNNLHLLKFDSKETRDQVVNKLHDLKHAFDLMGLEIEDYYKDMAGKYFPRQPIYYGAI